MLFRAHVAGLTSAAKAFNSEIRLDAGPKALLHLAYSRLRTLIGQQLENRIVTCDLGESLGRRAGRHGKIALHRGFEAV